jgi:dipeptidyl aminopeptidase/acylaminoacyl peptidase
MVRFLFVCLIMAAGFSKAAAAPPLEAYGKLPHIEMMRLSASGKRIAFAAVEGDTRRLFVRDLEGAAAPIITPKLGETKLRDIQWAGDDLLVITVSSTQKLSLHYKYEFYTALIVNLSTRSVSEVFSRDKGLYQFIYGGGTLRKIDGQWYGFFGGARYARINDYGLYRVALATGEVKLVAKPSGYIDEWYIGPDGSIIARVLNNQGQEDWKLLLGESGQTVVTAKKTSLGEISIEGLGRTPGTILIQDSTGDQDRTEELPLKANAESTPLFDGVKVEEYLHDPSTGLLIGAVVDDSGGTLFFDPTLQARFDAVRRAFKAYQVAYVTSDDKLDKIIVHTDGADDAGTFWLVDMTTGKASELDESYPLIRPENVGPTSLFDYKAGDGLSLQAVLTLPPGKAANNLPLVVFPHGGPIGFHDKLGFDWWAQAMASRGYAVLQPNFRGSGGYSAALRKASRGEWGRKMQTDLSDGVAALAAKGVIDPKHVCIVGASYGGYAALAGVTIQSGIYRCAVSYAGLSDLGRAMYEDGGSNRLTDVGRYFRTEMGVTYPGDPKLAPLSPVTLASKVTVPILLIHGKDDTVVPIEQSEEMETALRHAGKTYEFIRIDGEDHWLTREAGRVQTLQATMAFLAKYNPAD